MADPLLQVRALLALAASADKRADGLDEARNASYAAVKLINRFGIMLSPPAAGYGTSFPPPSVRVGKPAPPRAAPPKAKAPSKASAKEADDGWQKMKAKYEGHCKWCNKPVKPNTPIYWSKDHGAYHPVCYSSSKS
jgi:hypothetical protein